MEAQEMHEMLQLIHNYRGSNLFSPCCGALVFGAGVLYYLQSLSTHHVSDSKLNKNVFFGVYGHDRIRNKNEHCHGHG
jgi:hypothetical protein